MGKKGVNKADELLLRYAESRSMREIAKMLGGTVSPEALAARLDVLLDTRGSFLTDAKREKRLLLLLEDTLADIDEAVQDKDMLKIKLSVLREIGVRLDKRKDALETDLNRLYGNQGQLMVRAYSVAMSHMKRSILESPGGQIDEKAWDKLQYEALEAARLELRQFEVFEIE